MYPSCDCAKCSSGRVADFLSEYWEKIYLVLDALRIGRRDGTFVRIMHTVQNDNIEQASLEAQKFAELVMQSLESYLPGKNI